MRVPQATSTNRALAVTGDGTTALSARSAVPDGDDADGPTGGPAGRSSLVRDTAPTATRHAAASAVVPTATRRLTRSRRTARANDGSSVCGGASALVVRSSSDTRDIRSGRPVSSSVERAQAAQLNRWVSNSRRSDGDRAPRTYAASYRANVSMLTLLPPSPPVPGAGPAARSACVT